MKAIELFRSIMPCEVEVFPLAEVEQSRARVGGLGGAHAGGRVPTARS